MAEEKKESGKTNDYNKIPVQEYPKDYYTGDVHNTDGSKEFGDAVKNLDQSELGKLNQKLKNELEKGLNPKFALKK